MKNIWDLVYVWDMEHDRFVYFSPSVTTVYGYTQEEVLNMHWRELFHPDSLPEYERFLDRLRESLPPNAPTEEVIRSTEYRGLTKDGATLWLEMKFNFLEDRTGKRTHFVGVSRDITARKEAEAELEQAYETLLDKVNAQTNELGELNTALRVLLEKKDVYKEKYKEDIKSSITDLLLPQIEALRRSRLNERQSAMVERIEHSLRDIASPMVRSLQSGVLSLSPTDLEIASLIKQGKSTKEIAELMNISVKTVEFHRNKIRGRLSIRGRKMNIRTALLALDQRFNP